MKHAYFLIFVVQLISAFPNLLSEEESTESIDLSCNDIHDCIKIDENMHCFIDKVRILRILSYLISYFKQGVTDSPLPYSSLCPLKAPENHLFDSKLYLKFIYML